MKVEPLTLWAPRAWLPGGWAEQVVLRSDEDGRWCEVRAQAGLPPSGARALAGAVLPGLVNAHSHAFHRAFAGLAERFDAPGAGLHTWGALRDHVAVRLTPELLQAVASHLYVELLRGGYTHVVEFNDLHLQPDGSPYPDAQRMAWALADAAQEVGIGLTLVPVLREHARNGQALPEGQRRFARNLEHTLQEAQAVRESGRPLLHAALGVHALSAVQAPALAQLARTAGPELRVHVQIAEHQTYVQSWREATGTGPVEWLARQDLLGRHWTLVHGTHAGDEEVQAVGQAGASLVLCPSSEANLGDGLADLARWIEAGVPVALGSDSQVTRTWREELRWLDYGQRLLRQHRQGPAKSNTPSTSGAGRLWTMAQQGGAAAAGLERWGLVEGARADLLVIDTADASLLGTPAPQLLDALVFSSPGRPWRDTVVGGRFVVRNHLHPHSAAIAGRFERAMRSIWSL
ncbi:amidohydrolase family protein [Azohydromonas australica]|uniref:amidohydrolase family protein n=1 Tax=Azohydromonas australica TaxID=364039 RepID=UPI000404E7D1|nr:amidohydrolase family protein [Azohydromonas australica]